MVIVEYNENWPKYFLQIENILRKNLSKILTIEHVGSTSIFGMFAKPIIDIVIVIDDKNNLYKTMEELETIGYYHNDDQGIPGREVFKRTGVVYDDILDTISHHLYVCNFGNSEFKRHILFRDYLKTHEDARDQYNQIKQCILERVGYDNRKDYVNIKENEYKWFFEEIIKKAGEEI